MPLEEYRAKRDFGKTTEPTGGTPREGAASFVVQEHHARALHYDFRLELDGVLVSWAVPKGPSLDPHDKRLAVHVEDHPLDYGGFEGTIPAGEYGAGTVIVWDRGTWEPLGDPHEGMAKGDFKFVLHGEKLQGTWVLVRMKPRAGEKRENWLLIKEHDEYVRPHDEYDILAERPGSVLGDHQSPAPAAPSDASPATAPAPTPPASPTASTPAPFPTAVDLELCTLVDAPPATGEWLAEVKYDGYRVVLALEGGHARALTRSGADWSERFAPLLRALEELPAQTAVLDGQAVVFDEHGVSQFELLQRALGSAPQTVAYAAFDLLYLNGYDLRDQPLLRRKELLRDLLGDLPASSPLRFADHVTGDAEEFYRQACTSDLEGVVCKRPGSRYVAGRGREWVKVKCRQSQEFVVGGFTEGAGSRAELGSVLVGTYDGERLVYAGRVGSGLDEVTVKSLRAKLDAIERKTPAFDPPPHITGHTVHWVTPKLVVQAAFREWTSEGVLRQPVFLGLREDKPAKEVVRERPAKPSPSAASEQESASGSGTTVASREPQQKQGAQGPTGGHAGSEAKGSNKEPGRVPSPPLAPVRPASTSTIAGIHITNPEKLLFPDSPTFPKLALAQYYEHVAPLMLPEVVERPLTLLRCPVGDGRDCFYQRHPDKGAPKQLRTFKHSIKHEEFDFLYIDSAEGLIALAQMGVGEIHTWLSHVDTPRRPDRICFDLDPGPGVDWAHIRDAALLVREECESLGFSAFLKSTGSKGLHVVLPIEPVWEFERIRALSKAIVDRLVARHPDALVGKMAKDARGGRVFFDYLRNAEGASAVAPYSTRMKSGPSCAVPLSWDELTTDLDIRAFTPQRVIARIDAGADPWKALDDASAGVRKLKSAESKLAE